MPQKIVWFSSNLCNVPSQKYKEVGVLSLLLTSSYLNMLIERKRSLPVYESHFHYLPASRKSYSLLFFTYGSKSSDQSICSRLMPNSRSQITVST